MGWAKNGVGKLGRLVGFGERKEKGKGEGVWAQRTKEEEEKGKAF